MERQFEESKIEHQEYKSEDNKKMRIGCIRERSAWPILTLRSQ